MSDLLGYIQNNTQETQRLVGLKYEQLEQQEKRGVSQEIQAVEFKVRLKRNELSILLSRNSQNQHLIIKLPRKFSYFAGLSLTFTQF